MSVKKQLLARWERRDGFTSEANAVRFAAAIERKLGRFAFPDAFANAMKSFQDHVCSRHGKLNSPVGDVYRSIDQFRFLASPDWEAPDIEITMLAVLQSVPRLASDEAIRAELDEQCKAVQWPPGYKWSAQGFEIGTADDFNGGDILNSRLAD